MLSNKQFLNNQNKTERNLKEFALFCFFYQQFPTRIKNKTLHYFFILSLKMEDKSLLIVKFNLNLLSLEIKVFQMKKFLFLFSLLYVFNLSYSQETKKKKIDSLSYEITVNLSASNPALAFHLADSLFIYAASEHERVHALMLTASVFQTQEQITDAMTTAVKALEYSGETEDYGTQARLYGYLATLSRQIGFFDEGRQYLEKGIRKISQSDNPVEIESYKAMVNSEMAEFEMEMDNFEQALRFLDISLQYYKKRPENPQVAFQMSRIEEIRGRCFMGLNQVENALTAFQNANRYLKQSGAENTLYSALVYQGLGEMYLKTENLDSAQVYLQHALILAEPSTHNSLKEEVYGSLSEYYKKRNMSDSASFYIKEFESIARRNKQNRKHTVNAMARTLKLEKSHGAETNPKPWLIVGGGLMLIFGGVFFVLVRNLRNKPQDEEEFLDSQHKNDKNDKDDKDEHFISSETEKKLQERLILFETSKKYLNPNMTFSTLVSFLDTNPKYLNLLLKNNFQKDYNTYINDLRIKYIVQRIDNNQNYQKYKISHLAKESGFSSHSNFSANFKRVMELSPSEYIEKVKSEVSFTGTNQR